MSCKRQIRAHENIPILSYIFLLGKCAGCSEIIPRRIFVVELLSAVSVPFIIWYSLFAGYAFVETALFVAVFFIFEWIFFTDLEYGIIPDQSVAALVVLALLRIALHPADWWMYAVSGIAGLLFFLILFLGTRGRGMGFGDVKLSFALGLLLGYPGSIVAFYGAFLTGSLISLILISWRKKKFKKDSIPFGPFLVFSSLVALLFGEKIYYFILRVFP